MSEISNSNLNGKRQREQALPELKLTIKSQDGREFCYRFSAERKLRRLFMDYCKQRNLEYGTIDFLYDGNRLSSNRTPVEVGLVYGDTIDAMMRQGGGGFSS